MAITLSDDGTLDTVLRCDECGDEFRFNWDGAPSDDDDADELAALADANPTLNERQLQELLDKTLYDEWVDSCIAEIESEHECHAGDDEPQDGDITTEDHRTFYQDGRAILRVVDAPTGEYWEDRRLVDSRCGVYTWMPLGRFATVEQAVQAYMARSNYWPNVWSISDHGNVRRMDLTDK